MASILISQLQLPIKTALEQTSSQLRQFNNFLHLQK